MLLSRRPVFDGRVIAVAVERVALPNGHESDLEIVRHPGGAAIVAIDAEGRVCLLRQYRHAADGWVWELPAGKLEPGEPPVVTAARELVEEAAVSAGRIDSLGQLLSSPGVFTEVIHLFLARDLATATGAPEHGEVFEISWVPLREAVARALDGRIEDAKTVAGLVRAAAALGLLGAAAV